MLIAHYAKQFYMKIFNILLEKLFATPTC